MRLQHMDLNLFVVFEAIYNQGNLTRAAQQLHMTQPAVSNALGRLREHFDDPLFIRCPKGMQPTPVAHNIIDSVRQALQLLACSVQMGSAFNPQQDKRTFCISMHDLLEATLLPQLNQLLTRFAPNIRLSSANIPRTELTKELASGSLDLAIDPPLLSDSELHHQPLASSPYVCLVRPDHPKVSDHLTLTQYLGLRHIHISSRRNGLGYVDNILNQLGKKRKIQLRMRHYLAAPEVVASSDLAVTVPLFFARGTSLKVLPLPFQVPHQEWHLYWHRSAEQDSANTWLRALIFSNFNLTGD